MMAALQAELDAKDVEARQLRACLDRIKRTPPSAAWRAPNHPPPCEPVRRPELGYLLVLRVWCSATHASRPLCIRTECFLLIPVRAGSCGDQSVAEGLTPSHTSRSVVWPLWRPSRLGFESVWRESDSFAMIRLPLRAFRSLTSV